MAKKILENKLFWFKLSSGLTAAWFGITIIISVLSKDIEWSNHSDIGNAFALLIGGFIAIATLCNSIPWIYESLNESEHE